MFKENMSTDAQRKLDTGYRSSPGLSLGLSVAGFAIFLLITVLVQVRMLEDLDLSVAWMMPPLASDHLDALGAALSILFSGEVSLVLALLASFFLWRRGLRLWSMAPLAFLPLVAIEVVMKLTVQQPPVPEDLYRSVNYPLAAVSLTGSFPSGHSIRAGFLAAFAAVLLRSPRGIAAWAFPALSLLVAGLTAFTRIYLGEHWLSDVAAGMIFGAAPAQLLAGLLATRLQGKPG